MLKSGNGISTPCAILIITTNFYKQNIEINKSNQTIVNQCPLLTCYMTSQTKNLQENEMHFKLFPSSWLTGMMRPRYKDQWSCWTKYNSSQNNILLQNSACKKELQHYERCTKIHVALIWTLENEVDKFATSQLHW